MNFFGAFTKGEETNKRGSLNSCLCTPEKWLDFSRVVTSTYTNKGVVLFLLLLSTCLTPKNKFGIIWRARRFCFFFFSASFVGVGLSFVRPPLEGAHIDWWSQEEGREEKDKPKPPDKNNKRLGWLACTHRKERERERCDAMIWCVGRELEQVESVPARRWSIGSTQMKMKPNQDGIFKI